MQLHFFVYITGCRFRGERGEEKFVRLRENAVRGSEAFRISAFPRSGFQIQALDGVGICHIYKFGTMAHYIVILG